MSNGLGSERIPGTKSTFSVALQMLHDGERVARRSWAGKRWLAMLGGQILLVGAADHWPETIWSPLQEDMLAGDWFTVSHEQTRCPTAKLTREVDGIKLWTDVPVDGAGRYLSADLMRADLQMAMKLIDLGHSGPEALRFWRKSCGVTLEQMAQALGMNEKTVRRWESGEITAKWSIVSFYRKMVRDRYAGHPPIPRREKPVVCRAKAGDTIKVDVDFAPSSLTFSQLRHANVTRCESAYHPVDAWSLTDWLTAVAGEIGELAAEVQDAPALQAPMTAVTNALGRLAGAVKNIRRAESEGSSSHVIPSVDAGKLGREAADVVIYLDLLCRRAGIDLGEAVRLKFNEVSKRVGSSVQL